MVSYVARELRTCHRNAAGHTRIQDAATFESWFVSDVLISKDSRPTLAAFHDSNERWLPLRLMFSDLQSNK
jgi:hypothetical protein